MAKGKNVKKVSKKKEDSFLKQVKNEMKKVKWPDKNEMLKYTIATVVFIVVFGLYFFGLDILFAWFKGIVS